jgi:hypothetical protein
VPTGTRVSVTLEGHHLDDPRSAHSTTTT